MTYSEFALAFQGKRFIVKGTQDIFDLPSEFKKGEEIPKFLIYNTFFKKGKPSKRFELIQNDTHPIYGVVSTTKVKHRI